MTASSAGAAADRPDTGLPDTGLPDTGLPIEGIVGSLRSALVDHRHAALTAAPGAGKTTVVPLRLLGESWLDPTTTDRSRMVMLEPRRVAVRAAATRMASLLGERVGQTVGYRTRDDTVVGAGTRIEVVTEGILTRRIQNDPGLEGTGLVIFDEFHERNLVADLALALTLDGRDTFCPELRLLVMSATLDQQQVAALVGGDEGPAPIVHSAGLAHPVEIRWAPRHSSDRLEPAVVEAVERALREQPGDVLVFLPGAAQIRRVGEALKGQRGPAGEAVDVRPLFGALAPAEQDLALAPADPGRRKVVLSTDIAETSLTVDGVVTVIDSGLVRAPRFDVGTGMTRLTTISHSQASADQRAGRAGRTAAGVAIRLWSQAEHSARPRFTAPEITQVELSGLVLELAAWGVTDPADLAELALADPPPSRALAEGRELLTALGALDGGRLTETGRAMVALPLHPRLARMVVDSGGGERSRLACLIAELVGERDVLRGRPDDVPVDLALRVELLTDRTKRHPLADGAAIARTRKRADRLARRAGTRESTSGKSTESGGLVDPSVVGAVLALAYPDRIAQARPAPAGDAPSGRFRLANGSGAWLPAHDPLAASETLVVADLDGDRREARIRLAAALDRHDLEAITAGERAEVVSRFWDDERNALIERVEQRSGGVVLASVDRAPTPGAETEAALVARVADKGLRVLRWSKEARSVRGRLEFAASRLGDEWPDVSDAALLATLDTWLAPYVVGATTRADLERVDVAVALKGLVGYPRAGRLDQLLPPRYVLPDGTSRALVYDEHEVSLSTRVQDLYDLDEHPTVLDGAVPIVVELLSPAQRPIQRTSDLPGFWQGSWAEVRKDMRGRYPKHNWER